MFFWFCLARTKTKVEDDPIWALHYRCLDIYCLYVKLETPVKLEDEIVQKSFTDEFHKLGVNLQFTAAVYRNEFRGPGWRAANHSD